MKINYLDGSELSYLNSERLQTSARIILEHEDGTDSFGLFLYYIAFEEMAKAVYCIMLHNKLLDKESESAIFKDHKVKIFLFDELTRSFKTDRDGKYTLGGKPLGKKSLKEFVNEHAKSIKKHRHKTTNFLYVNKRNQEWYVPKVKIDNLEKEVKEIEDKIAILSIVRHMLKSSFKQFKFSKMKYEKKSSGQDFMEFS